MGISGILRHTPGAVFLVAAGLAAGCDSGLPYGEVQGVVMLDEEPLEGAILTFTPDFADGHASYGKTDVKGNYRLGESETISGAVAGQYTVRISTFDAGKPDVDPPIAFVQERVPMKYNIKSTLTREVKPGKNEINFELDSEGQVMTIDPEDLY